MKAENPELMYYARPRDYVKFLYEIAYDGSSRRLVTGDHIAH